MKPRRSRHSPRRSRQLTGAAHERETTKFGADLIQAMSEALAHAQSKDVAGIKAHGAEVGAVDAKAVRKKLDLTQDEMATVLGREKAAEWRCA